MKDKKEKKIKGRELHICTKKLHLARPLYRYSLKDKSNRIDRSIHHQPIITPHTLEDARPLFCPRIYPSLLQRPGGRYFRIPILETAPLIPGFRLNNGKKIAIQFVEDEAKSKKERYLTDHPRFWHPSENARLIEGIFAETANRFCGVNKRNEGEFSLNSVHPFLIATLNRYIHRELSEAPPSGRNRSVYGWWDHCVNNYTSEGISQLLLLQKARSRLTRDVTIYPNAIMVDKDPEVRFAPMITNNYELTSNGKIHV